MHINFFGSVYSASGYSEGNRRMLMEMYKQNIDISFLSATPPDPGFILNKTTASILHEMELKSFSYNSPTIQRIPARMMETRMPGYNVGYTVFECNRLPSMWVKTLNKMDNVWTSSHRGAEMFENSGVLESVKIVPEGVDINEYDPETVKPFPNIKDPDKFSFLFVGQWHKRKGYDVLLDAYLSSFDYDDDVELILKTYIDGNIEKEQKWIKKVVSEFAKNKKLKKIPSIKIHTYPVSPEMMPCFYKSADAVVIPTRGEGSCLPGLEAMSMAKPLLISDCTGQTEYIYPKPKKKLVAYPIKINGVSNVEDMEWISVDYRHMLWYEPDIEDLCIKMKEVFYHQDKAKKTGERGRKHIVENFTWKHTVDKIRKILDEK